MTRSYDLVPLLSQKSPDGLGRRQGVLLSFDSVNGYNTVDVGGTVLTDLPVLSASEASSLEAGDVVTVISDGHGYAILGKLMIPGSADAIGRLSSLTPQTNAVATKESTASSTPTDLSTVGPVVSIYVPKSGRLLVTTSATIEVKPPSLGGGGTSTADAYMTFSATGANVIATGLSHAITSSLGYTSTAAFSLDAEDTKVGVFLLEGLNPGNTTFTAKYYTLTPPTAAFFSLRTMTIQAL